MRKLIILALAATMFAACSSSNEKMVNGFMDLARQRFAVREYAQTPVEQAKLDSILEAGRLAQRLSPRQKRSHWTELNKQRFADLEARGLMTDLGRAALQKAK